MPNNLIKKNKIHPEDRTNLNITFEYLDQNNGAVVQIFHTGLSEEDLEFVGRLKGCNIKKENSPLSNHASMIGFALGGIFEISALILLFSFANTTYMSRTLFAIIAIAILLTTYLILTGIKRFLKVHDSLPEGLRMFDEISKNGKGQHHDKVNYSYMKKFGNKV